MKTIRENLLANFQNVLFKDVVSETGLDLFVEK